MVPSRHRDRAWLVLLALGSSSSPGLYLRHGQTHGPPHHDLGALCLLLAQLWLEPGGS